MSKEQSVKRTKSCAQAYKRLFSTVDGEKVLTDMMRVHGFMGNNFSKDPIELAYLAGQRAVVERIIALTKMDLGQLDKRLEQAMRKDPFWVDPQD